MDERLINIENQKQQALNDSDNLYNGLLNDNQNLYNQQKNYANQYEKTQNNILDKQLAYNTGLIEQQKDIAKENARVEQNKAKNDYFSYINPYGLQAESLASQGLLNSGVSETAKLGGYNTYQNRLASANKTMQDAIRQYDNDINQARLTNDTAKAQKALKKLELQLNFAENFYNKKGEISQNQFNSRQNVDNNYYNRYQTEYKNIQDEKARAEAIRQWEAEMAEQQRQYNDRMAYQRERDRVADEQWQKEYALSQQARAASSKSSSGNYNSNGHSDGQLSNNNGYQVVSTDENGWGKTNLTQRLSNGGTAEVFESPEGELLYWNPNTNGWSRYGSVDVAVNSGSGRLKSTYTPNLSSIEASKWMSQNAKPNMTESDLARLISEGEDRGIFKPGDRERIYKSYGL